jgi:hypothetical protein
MTAKGFTATIASGSNYFEISKPLSSASIAAGKTATVYVRPKTGLKAGAYAGKLKITWAGASQPLYVTLKFTVLPK